MPVLITGATGLVGRALAHRLLDEGAQVRAYIRRDDPELRAAGAYIAIGSIDDVPRLESALTRVHTIVHLIGGWWPEPGVTEDYLNRDTAESAAIAAHAAGVRRFVYLSAPGADAASDNALLSSFGRAEAHILGADCEHAIIRAVPARERLAAWFARARRGGAIPVPGSGRQRLNPPTVASLVDAIVAADARDAAVEGVWDFGGVSEVTLDECARAADPEARLSHGRWRSGFPRALADVLGSDLVVDPSGARRALGLAAG